MVLEILKKARLQGVTLFLDEQGQLRFKKKSGKLSAELKAELTANKQELIALFRAQQEKLVAITSIDRSGAIPASFSQQRLWLIDKLEGSQHYNVAAALACDGVLDIAAIEASLTQIVARHEALRTCFEAHDGVCMQRVMPARAVTVEVVNLVDCGEDEVQRQVDDAAREVFDLSQDLMLRTKIIKQSQTRHILLFTLHHIASDGWSMQLLIKEFNAFYQAAITGGEADVPELPVQYGDYAYWQQQQLTEQNKAQLLRYWQARLSGMPSLHGLPLDKPRPAKQEFTSGYVRSRIGKETLAGLQALTQSAGVTLFMVLQGAFAVLLSRLSGESDIVLGVPTAGRSESELSPLIGFFINTLVSRTEVDLAQPFTALLAQIKADTLADYQHQGLPFELLVEALNPDRSLAYNPLCQVKLVLQNHRSSDDEGLSLGEARLKPLQQSQEQVRFDLDLTCSEGEGELLCHWRYQQSLFTEATIAAYARSFEYLLESIAKGAQGSCKSLALYDDEMRQSLIEESVGAACDYRRGESVVEQFARQAQQTPERIAVRDESHALSYGELYSRVNQLAHYLQEQDIGVGERVALVMTRDVTLLVAMLGVMATGASYIPLSPDNQTARLADIFNDADVTQVLVSTCLLEILPVSGVDVLMLDEDEWGLSGYDSHPVGVTHTLADSAYVIYTSGSTGKPKGVEVSHRGLIDYCGYGLKAYYQEQLTGSYVLTSHAFDIGVPSLYLPLLVGGCVNLAPWGEELEGLVERLRGSSEASLFRLTPMHCEALLELLDGDKVSGAHVLVIGGETLTEGLAARLQDTFSESQLYNHYGPTETVVGCSLYDASAHLRAGDSTREEIPIGYAMANTGLYVVDAGGELQAKGGVGELYVGGPCVAKGYVGDPDRTAASFVYVPWLADTRLYRTGDRVRRLESGALVFLGRKDEQVKLRGYRIELGEIRSVLAQQAAVKQAAVLVQGEGADATLVGYVVAEGEVVDEGIFIAELERALSARLASYMCPSRWCLLDALPLTANGKLDRGALPSEIGEIGQEYEAAENSVERALVEIWAEVLRQPLEELSVTGDFFRLGGNSLLAVKLSALIKRHFDIEVTLGDLFSHPNIRQFGMWLQSHQEIQAKHTYEKIKAQDNLDSAPLTFAQQRLWFIDALQGGTYAYNITRALTLSGEVDISALQRVFVALIERHAIFRTTYQAHVNEQALQIIHAAHTVNFNIEQVDLTHLESEEQETEITQRLEEQQKYTFNLADDVMLKVSLLLCQVDKSILIINMPHIATDGWSMDILTRECWALYEAFTQGQQNPLTALPLQYADYALWQSKQLTPDTLDTHWQYWQQQLAAMPQVHSLPLDFKRPADKNYVGEQVSSRLSSEVASKLCRLAKHYALTPFMLSHALCALVLSRHSGSHDIVMGMPIANRLQGELNGVVGLFVNTLVLRVNTNYNDLSDYFKHVKKVHLEAQQHQDMPFEKLVDKLASERSASHTPLFQILLATQNDFSSKPVPQNQALIVERREQKVKVAKFDLDINICINKDEVTINWTYDTAIFSHHHITTLDRHLCNLLSTLAAHHEDQDIAIKQLNILDAQEFTRLLTRAAGNTNYPAANCGLHELFERQVERQPEALAITSAGRSLSYAQLNARANAMAWYLIEQYQLTPEQTVAICLPRSELLLVSVLAVLKAGGAYLTIDPSYPDGRVSYILNDSEASLLLTSSELEKRLVELRGTFSCVMADTSLTNYSQDNPPSPILNSDVASAYIVYTSGTSGKPKGVKIAHKGAVNFAAYLGRQFQVDNSSKVLQLASTSFDAFTLEWMWGLTNGGTLCICSEADKYHPQQMADYLVDQGITHALITPAYLQHLPCHQNYHFRALLVGGEACSTALAQQWSKHYPMYNAYGPSEATICATVAKLHPDTSVTIGTAIDNVTTYILDDQQQLLPEGAVGELYIGGVGVAQGYIKRPELDAERFVSNPFVTNEHEKLYRTGDLVRQSDTGQLVYVGRIDEQVKIRGYRIELAEIEQLLNESFGVKQAAVLCWGEGSQKYLIAYVMLSGEMSEDSATRILSEALAEQLPEYMVPSQFVVLEQFPLTVNGKVDKRALPQPELTTAHYRGPQNKTEAQLQQLWSSLLKIPQASLSCEANFFALGGDSILSIQLVSRAAEQGLYFSVKDLFRHQHIVALARCVKQSKGYTIAQEAVIGEMPLLPIQQAFFKNETALAHFNQSVLLSTPEDFDTQCLIPMLQALVTRHDALRLSFDKSQGQWRGWYQALEALALSNCIEQHEWDGEAESLTAIAERAQRSLSPIDGELLRLVYLANKAGTGRLLLVIHHLVVDGVSWRILLSDIAQLYQQYQAGEALQLGDKTHSYQQWGRHLQRYSESEGLQQQRSYWRELEADNSWQQHYGHEQVQAGVRRQLQIQLSEDETQALLTMVPQSYRTQVNEVLLAALWLAHQRCSGAQTLSVTLEGHGREGVAGVIDLSQTVGWFTSVYPLQLSVQAAEDVGGILMAVKEQYRQVPDTGIGYGVLKYLCGDSELADKTMPALQFNYLGQFDQTVKQTGAFSIAEENRGQHISAARIAQEELVLNGKVVFGSLGFTLNYDTGCYCEGALSTLMKAYEQALRDVITHCKAVGVGPYTPSDFPLARVTTEELERWDIGSDIADLYPATGMQQGLLFHGLLEAGSYVTQTRISFKDLDASAFKAAWLAVIERHNIFRTAFVGIEQGNAHQRVSAHAVLPWKEEDLREMSQAQQQHYLDDYQRMDKRKAFAIDAAPLMRFSLFNVGDEHTLLWSYHHALLDGWCIPLVFKEIKQCYEALCAGIPLASGAPEYSYRDYAQWLSEQDKEETVAFWRDTLAPLSSHTQLPAEQGEVGAGEGEYRIEFSVSETAALQRLAAEARTTLNIVVQTAWGVLLQRYGNQGAVVFGSVTSGRPASLAGVESILGLFINTVPVVVESGAEETVLGLLQAQHEQQVAREGHSYYPLYEIQKQSPLGEPLFNSVFVFENYPVDAQLSEVDEQSGLEVTTAETTEGTNYDLTVVAHVSEGLSIRLEGGAGHYNSASLARLGGHYKRLLLGLTKALKVAEVELLSERERSYLLTELNSTAQDVEVPSCLLHELFERQVKSQPDAVAVETASESISYGQLNQRANQLARQLQHQAVQLGDAVGILLTRSVNMVVAVLAVLKAGGRYVPLDPNYPKQRLEYIVADTQLQHVICNEHTQGLLDIAGVTLWQLDATKLQQDLAQQCRDNLGRHPQATSDQPSYLIYTSGSTGKPKGVVIAHRNALAMVQWAGEFYQPEELAGVLASTSLNFDLSVFELFVPLSFGGKVILVENILTLLNEDIAGISLINTVPSGIDALLAAQRLPSSVLSVNLAGEPLAQTVVEKLFNGRELRRVVNLYGPSEDTTYSTYYEMTAAPEQAPRIGRPVSNTQAYVLGEQGELLPFGVTGELYLGGAGVACGYLNQPQLTAQRFIPDRFSHNTDARLYRTGDLVRYDQQGELCFIGRVDEQVKLRGFRIELGEIEHHLNSHDAVIESLVLVVEEAGESQLQAYVRTEEATGLAQQLREYLRALLPEYMLPSRYIAVSQWPLSPNGKIDKNALKQLHSNTELEAFIAPRDATEEQLLLIWQRLLKNDAIGINDHFFTVGGDSIIAIQLVAMAREVGLHITLKEVMQLPTVADQALVVKASKEVSAEQSPLSGEFRPLPIQLRFLQRSKGAAVHHYNQSILLQVPIELSQDFLRQAVSCLLDRHDALRLRFTHKSIGWMGEFIALEQIDINRVVQNVFVADWSAEAVTEIAAAAQSGFNISKGELFKAVLISGKSEARLLLVAHHLVVDGVSWRILVQDLQRLWCQHQRQEIPRLPAKTSSIRQWSDTLALHYDDFQAQQVFWLAQLAAENTMMPLSESEIEPCLRSESEIVKLQLTHSVTRQLLGSANQAYRTQVEDLLLSGLYLALQQTFAVSQVAVALESHGRDPISDDVDLSETVGWFTSLYPLLLSSEGTGLTEVIIAVKERRRVISESNVGFGTLKYYSQTSECSHFEQADPFVLFNYLGQIEINAEHEHGDFSLANESMGSNLHEQALREFAIAINGQVSEGLLHLMIDYSVAQFSPETMVALKNNLAMALQDIANHCEGRMPMLTTSDVPHVELQQSQLNEWQKRFGTLINIFPATPLQHGIFFQSQIDKKAYLTQVVNQISGELNIKAMELAWQYVTNRHEILRSGFAIEKSSLYRFVLAPDIKVPVRFLDWSDLSDEQRHSAFITLREQDREMAMPLNEAPLHRVTIVRYDSMQHQLLWTHHHLILDGWCLQTVYQELLQSYLSFANSQPLSLPKPIPLDGYYDWLQSKDKQSALDYWHTYLHDFDSPTALLESQNLDVQSGYVERQWQISTSLSQKLRVLASEAKVTLNAVIQWAWGYLLQRYSGDQKVLFGTVISGRPSEVQNIEKMVGLFINTIPVKVDFVPSTDLKAQLKQLHESQLQSQEHGFLTLPEIRQQTAIAAEVELFDSIVVFENYPTESNSSVANNTSDVVINSSETAEYSAVPLTFIVNDSEHLQLTLGYRKERFSDNTIAQMQHHLDAIFSQLADGRGVGEISLLSTSEQHLLAQQHDTFCSHNLALLPHQYVDHFAQVTPNSIAVLDTQETLTYQQLNQAANRLARLLQAQGVMQESFVALYLERHCSMVIAILAVLKAGGAYVPIDPSMPDARSSAILDQLGDVQVLTQQHLAEAECLQSHQVTVIDSEATLDTLFQYRATTPSTFELSATNLAYMIFTSGTTGQPKGVMVEHQALLNRVLWMQKQYGLKASDKVLQKTPYGFDVSVWEFVWPWTVGASIVLAKPEGHKEPKYLAELIQRQGITHCHFVPSMLQAFMQHAELSQCQTLKQVFCSGEALTRDHREQFIRASSAQLHNLYGPTEAAIDVSYWDCSKTTSAPSVPIGYAIDNINCVVVSPDFAEQPIGIPGELLISGIGLARGYFQQEQLTAEKFITVSLANRCQQRYYRTGDLVRRLECGALEFLGRLDHQVKIRGLRVELGEIQAAIAGCDEVEEAFVSVQELQAGEQLIAFCVTSLDSAELSAVIPKLLASTLPNYMIPATYIALTELPVTVNGKLDRKALYSMVTAQPQIEYVPAHTATEVALEEVWRECLGITEPLSTVQSFFALGGNSLHAMSILDRVQSHWDYPFEIADLFAFQTIKELAQFIDATQSQYSSEQQELEADSEAFEEMEF